jgi:sarcosine oxidase gamma subunit
MTRLAFLSPHEADVPGAPALAKLEVRGGIPEGAIPIGPARGLVVVEGDPRAERDRLTAAGYRVYDLSAALASLEVDGVQLMRRLTELDLDRLPAIGAVARGTTAIVERLGPDRFRLHVPTELAQYVADTIADQAEGLAR